jgi:predicted SnoaL-like aldol condensation-catalyzing enzyme
MKKLVSTFTALILVIFTHYVFACDIKQEQINKKVVVDFYNAAINKKDFTAASKYLGKKYTQHNPTAANGPEGLKTFIEFLKKNYPNAHSDIKKAFVDDDYVILQVHSVRVPGTRGRAIFDLFKLENGKIVEHWDVVQDIPEKSANSNGMF